MDQLERIRGVTERVAASEGMEVVDVELHGRGRGAMVRIFLDKPGGVTHGDCQAVSRQVGMILDVEEVMPASYTLEVSSPGLDRRLTRPADFERFAGQQVRIEMEFPIDGQRRFQGRLVGMENGAVLVQLETGQMAAMPHAQIRRANLVPVFPMPGLQKKVNPVKGR